MPQARDLEVFEKTLGYRFRDRALLELALTHASAAAGKPEAASNERLEFLGDRVLGLAIADLLTQTFPDAPEGALARRFNRLVRRETCAAVGRALDIGAYLTLSSGEAESGGRDKTTILADACEAVLGAIYQDRGFKKARKVIRRWWAPYIEAVTHIKADAKSALQEWAQGLGLALPDYREVAREGPDHEPRFTVEVRISGLAPARGMGASKRAAEQAAARAMLEREGVWEAGKNDGNRRSAAS